VNLGNNLFCKDQLKRVWASLHRRELCGKPLRSLSLAFVSLTDCVPDLKNAIFGLKELEYLDLRCCQLDTKAFLALEDAMKDSKLARLQAQLNTYKRTQLETEAPELYRRLDKPNQEGG